MTKTLLAAGALAGLLLVAAVVATRDPVDAQSIGAVILGAAMAIGCGAARAGLWLAEQGRARRTRRAERADALRRGVGLGALIAALAVLRAVDGLTVVTGGLVVGGFLIAEIVMTRPIARSG